MSAGTGTARDVGSVYAGVRLIASVLLSTIGSVAMWSIAVALPAVEAEFGADRAAVTGLYSSRLISVSAFLYRGHAAASPGRAAAGTRSNSNSIFSVSRGRSRGARMAARRQFLTVRDPLRGVK